MFKNITLCILGEEEGEETSDYETDPYSQSDPISVRSNHSRSHSNTTSETREFRTKAHSISVDSGQYLDCHKVVVR